MSSYPLRAAAALVLFATSAAAQSPAPRITYPSAAKSDQVDVYHGETIADPYRWLEDTDSPQTKAWVEAENAVTNRYLATVPERDAIRNRLTQLWNYARFSAPFKEGGRYFYFQNTGLQNQSVLFVQDGKNRPPRVLLDPNVLSADGTVALSGRAASPDGRALAYSVSVSGSDWQEIRVRDVMTGRDLADVLKWVKFSGISWTRDNRGFFYTRYDAPAGGNSLLSANKNHKLYYHRLGQAQSRDQLIYDRP
ncbi:MAG: S9 family peptidase, partial [Gemmatimonadaceae bacterium]|nr:S9 family peptidase [Gemmatimonadaceae bacterium]